MEHSWILLGVTEILIFIYLMALVYILITNNVEQFNRSRNETVQYAAMTAMNMTLRGLFNKAKNNGFQSLTYKVVRLILMILGFVTFSYYKAMLNAALNVDVNNIPLETWEDIANSHYKILVGMGTADEDSFKYGNAVKQRIHREKILTVVPAQQLQNVGYHGSVPAILSDEYIAIDNVLLFASHEAFPCGIIDMPSPALRLVIKRTTHISNKILSF